MSGNLKLNVHKGAAACYNLIYCIRGFLPKGTSDAAWIFKCRDHRESICHVTEDEKLKEAEKIEKSLKIV